MATKPNKTPTLQIADAVAQLAAGATLEDVAPAAEQSTVTVAPPPPAPPLAPADPASDPANRPAGDAADRLAAEAAGDPNAPGVFPHGKDAASSTPAPAVPVAPQQDALLAHFKQEAAGLGKANQDLSIKLALMGNELAQAQAQATAHAELLGGLTQAACAAINIRHIQLGRRSADLTHLTPQTALAEFNAVHGEFLDAFSAGRHTAVGQEPGAGADKAPPVAVVRKMTGFAAP
jgi:hypothetical protein